MRPLIGVGVAAVLAFTVAGCDRKGVVQGGATLASSAGSVQVQCVDRVLAKIVGTAPAPGYTARIIDEGPSGQPSVVFENPNANDFKVAVNCRNSEPRIDEFEIEDTTLTD
jgi:hypothetical protein